MSFSYYIKNRTSDAHGGTTLMSAIYDCCTSGNYGRSKVHTENRNRISTNIFFQDLTRNLTETEIEKMDCGHLSRDYLYNSYMRKNTSALICIDDNTDEIHTLLTFYFNSEKKCIEIDAFCSKPGGGTIFNFLINAIKCGIEKCKKTHNYERKFILKSLNNEETLGFYTKYGMKEPIESAQKNKKKKLGKNDLVPLTRALSVESNQDLDENDDIDDALMFDLSFFEEETKKQNKKSTKKSSHESDDDNNIDYYTIIDDYFNRNRNIYYTNMFLRPDPPTNPLYNSEAIAEAARDYNEQLNESNSLESEYSPSDEKPRKRGRPASRTTKKGGRKNKTNKKTQTQKYKYKTK